MIFLKKNTFARMLSLLLVLCMSISFLGAAAPLDQPKETGNAESAVQPIPDSKKDSADSEKEEADNIQKQEKPVSSENSLSAPAASGRQEKQESHIDPEASEKRQAEGTAGAKLPQPDSLGKNDPPAGEPAGNQSEASDTESSQNSGPTDPSNEAASNSSPAAVSWSWVYADPTLQDVLGKEQDTGLYILDILQADMPLEALAGILPQAVRFCLSDLTETVLSIEYWETTYPEAGIPTPEADTDFPFTPVFSEVSPEMAENLAAPGFLARVAGVEGPQLLPSEIYTQSVNFYTILDNKRVDVGPNPHQVISYTFGTERRYLDSWTLANVYDPYGFKEEMLQQDTLYFPHADVGGDVWAEPCHTDEGQVYSPILQSGNTADVYYLPRQSLTADHTGHPYQEFAAQGPGYDGFYTVRVEDPKGLAYDNPAVLPSSRIVPCGQGDDFSLTPDRTVTWTVDGSADFQIDGNHILLQNINSPVVIRPMEVPLKEGEKQIFYDINLPHEPFNAEFECPLIKDGRIYSEIVSRDHSVLPLQPSYYYAYTVPNEKWLAKISFEYWEGDDGHSYLPGEVIPADYYQGRELTLRAHWKIERASPVSWDTAMVNFYVALTPVQEGDQTWTATGEDAGYTNSVYTADCGVSIKDFTRAVSDSRNRTLLGGNSTSQKTLDTCYNEVMQLQSGWDYTTQYGEVLHFQVDFPTDEEVLSHIRAMPDEARGKIQIGGHSLPREAFTTDNFTIKWSKFSSSSEKGAADGWHIDGVLTVKKSKLIVKKSFSGDGNAVEAVKGGDFRILVESVNSGSTTHDGNVLALRESGDALLPVSYNAETDEYTWIVPVDPMWQYRIREENDSAEGYEAYRWYSIRNSYEKSENTGSSWQKVSASQEIICTTRSGNDRDNNYTTVSFKNTYTRPDTLTMTKLDGFSKNPMPGVRFAVSYQSADGTEEADLGTRVTDNRGVITIDNAHAGTYSFREEVPRGYSDPGLIQVEVMVKDASPSLFIGISSAENSFSLNPELPTVEHTQDTMEFTVYNYARTFVPVTAHKSWGNNSPAQDVTLQLMINGKSMGEGFQAKIPASTLGSSYTWENLPVYIKLPVIVDQVPAHYSIQELAIGNMSYSPDFDSGYRYYNVLLGPMTYVLKDKQFTTVMPEDDTQIDRITLEITNTKRTGNPTIRKTDTKGYPLAGAQFTLYEKPESGPIPQVIVGDTGNRLDLRMAAVAVSDSNGFVNFGATLPAGEYYLVESRVPEGYRNSPELYMLDFDSVSVHLKKWSGSSWQNIGSNTVVNAPVYVNLIIANRTEGNMADMRMPFEFYLGSNRPILKEGKGNQEESTQYIFYLKNNEQTDSGFTLKLQSGSHISLSQTNGYEYTASFTVTRTNSETQTQTVTKGAGFTMLDELIQGLPDNSTIRVDIVNTLDGSPETGTELESMPFLILLGLAAAGLACLFLTGRRRRI